MDDGSSNSYVRTYIALGIAKVPDSLAPMMHRAGPTHGTYDDAFEQLVRETYILCQIDLMVNNPGHQPRSH